VTTFVFAHGAGGHRDDRGMLQMTKVLEALGIAVVRFNFPYREQGSKRPDAMPALKARMREVIGGVRDKPLLIGGRSMGGRVATMLAADGFACDGLLVFAYPLHPPGQPEKLRSEHLPRITAPVLCFNGTRDPFCTPELMSDAVAGLKTWTMHWLEGADHSFRVLKRSGRSDAEVLAEVGETVSRWKAAVLP
jgi:predicted alpha/beta-hydrolase family hydrolase